MNFCENFFFFLSNFNLKAKYQPDRYYLNVRDTLDYFRSNLPRTLINMVLTLDVTGIEVLNNGYVCKTMHKYVL